MQIMKLIQTLGFKTLRASINEQYLYKEHPNINFTFNQQSH